MQREPKSVLANGPDRYADLSLAEVLDYQVSFSRELSFLMESA
ncbi:hypothetical protein [Bradyrhizobium sp. BR 1433]